MRLLIGITCLLLLSSCDAQKPDVAKNNEMDTTVKIPVVNPDFERIDTSRYDLSKGPAVGMDEDGARTETDTQSYGFIERITPRQSYFMIIKQYYKNGSIMAKGVVFSSGAFKEGTWYTYNEQGNLTNKEDNNQEYTYRFGQLFDYLHERHIPLTRGYIAPYTGIHTTIRKSTDDGPKWVVRWLKSPMVIEELIISGKTGKLLERNEIRRREG